MHVDDESSFCLLKMPLLYFCVFKLLFSGHRILDWLRVFCWSCLFLLQHLKGMSPYLLTGFMSNETSAVFPVISFCLALYNCYNILLYHCSYVCDLLVFPLGTYKMFLYFLSSNLIMIGLDVVFFVLILFIGSVCFLSPN